MKRTFDPHAEWLEADGLGGFASGTVGGRRTRRYHALLLTAATPPTGRMVLLNGLEVWATTPAGRFALSSQHYAPDVVHPDGERRLASFSHEPWPAWTYELEDGTRIEQELFVPHGQSAVALRWRLVEPRGDVRLEVRPLFCGRDYHSLHHENGAFRFAPHRSDGALVWRPYESVPETSLRANGDYRHDPAWYRNFLYFEERERGLDYVEDLASPGAIDFDLSRGEAVLIATCAKAASPGATAVSAVRHPASSPLDVYRELRDHEQARRAAFATPLDRAADAYLVRRGAGKTIVAGYPWFTDWGRDTFIALRGLCLATGRLDDACEILLAWSGTVSRGMLPNRFPDRGEEPEYNSVDASLWYVVAVHEYLAAAECAGQTPLADDRARLAAAVEQILDGYTAGTRYGIRQDEDGLLAAGEPGVQLTWMDVKLGDWVVTPRIGKPVEVQALWYNALRAGAAFHARWGAAADCALAAFGDRYWNADRGCLYDVVDVDHVRGTADPTLRPNQLLAIGGLPFALVDGERARRVVDLVEAKLWTPLGPRSLAPDEAGYAPRYAGGVAERDPAYHQGTVWPWLAGAFVEAWVRVRGGTFGARDEARRRFLPGLLAHLEDAGLGHVSEIADAEPPHAPRGCPFQAWSLGELLRLTRCVLAKESPPRPAAGEPSAASQAVERKVQERTGGRVAQLQAGVVGNRVLVAGTAPTYYLKQLALRAVAEALAAFPLLRPEIEIQVEG